MLKNHNEIKLTQVTNENQPRERLAKLGAAALSDQELLAIILRGGTKEQPVGALAHEVLGKFETLFGLKMASLEELQEIKGIGVVKATEILATLELGRRLAQAKRPYLGQVTGSKALGEMMIGELKDLQQEHLVGIFLNTRNEIIRKETIFIGTLNQSIAHPREIFRAAVKCSAARIVLVHNHPSGDLRPSPQDVNFTERMMESGKMLGIEVIDHLIVTEGAYASVRESGLRA